MLVSPALIIWFFAGLVAQEVPSCQYLRVALLRVANYTASVVLVINLLIEFNPIAPRAMQLQFKVLTWTFAQTGLLVDEGFKILEDEDHKDSLVGFLEIPEGWTLVFNERHQFGDVCDPDGVLRVRLLSQTYRDNNNVMVFQSMMVLPMNNQEHKEGRGWFKND